VWFVGGDSQRNDLSALELGQPGQQMHVVAAGIGPFSQGPQGSDLIARRQQGHSRLATDGHPFAPEGSNEGQTRWIQNRPDGNQQFALASVLPCRRNPVALPISLLQNQVLSLYRNLFLRCHGIGTGRKRRPGENANSFSRTNAASPGTTRSDPPGENPKDRRAGGNRLEAVGAAQGITVQAGARFAGKIAVGNHVLRENAAKRFLQPHEFRCQGRNESPGRLPGFDQVHWSCSRFCGVLILLKLRPSGSTVRQSASGRTFTLTFGKKLTIFLSPFSRAAATGARQRRE